MLNSLPVCITNTNGNLNSLYTPHPGSNIISYVNGILSIYFVKWLFRLDTNTCYRVWHIAKLGWEFIPLNCVVCLVMCVCRKNA